MRVNMLAKLAWRNLWRNRLRTSIMLSAIVVGLIGVVSLMGFISGMGKSMIDNGIAWGSGHIQIHHQDYLANPELKHTLLDQSALTAHLDSAEQSGQIAAWSGRFVADGMVGSARSTRGIRINGIMPEREGLVSPLKASLTEGNWLDDQGRNPVLVSRKTAERLRLRLGSKVVITFSDIEGEVSGAAFRVRGIFSGPSTAFDDGNLFVRHSDLSRLAGHSGLHEITVMLVDLPANSPVSASQQRTAVRDQLQQLTQSENQVRDWTQIQPMLAAMVTQLGTSNGAILGIFVLAMSFGIVNVMLMAVFERTREFGVLMAVGMERGHIFRLIVLETVLMSLSGAAIALALSMGLIHLLQQTGIPMTGMGEGMGALGVDDVLYPEVTAGDYQMILITVFVASMLAAIYPARQILKKNPVNAMAQKH